MNKEEKEKLGQAEQDRRALLQMYQAGFLDGYNRNSLIHRNFNSRIKKKCIESFERRFMLKIAKKLKNTERGRKWKQKQIKKSNLHKK